MHFGMSSAICFNLDQCKILWSGNELNLMIRSVIVRIGFHGYTMQSPSRRHEQYEPTQVGLRQAGPSLEIFPSKIYSMSKGLAQGIV